MSSHYVVKIQGESEKKYNILTNFLWKIRFYILEK